MPVEATTSSHVKNIRSIIRKLVEVKAVVDEEDAKAILLNILPFKYNSVVFTLSRLPSQSMDETILAFIVE
jgi:hypothetical protein